MWAKFSLLMYNILHSAFVRSWRRIPLCCHIPCLFKFTPCFYQKKNLHWRIEYCQSCWCLKSTWAKVVYYCRFWTELFSQSHRRSCHPLSQLTKCIRYLVVWERNIVAPLHEHREIILETNYCACKVKWDKHRCAKEQWTTNKRYTQCAQGSNGKGPCWK